MAKASELSFTNLPRRNDATLVSLNGSLFIYCTCQTGAEKPTLRVLLLKHTKIFYNPTHEERSSSLRSRSSMAIFIQDRLSVALFSYINTNKKTLYILLKEYFMKRRRTYFFLCTRQLRLETFITFHLAIVT